MSRAERTGRRLRALVVVVSCVAGRLEAAEIVTITPELIARGADGGPPTGKEADWILGDHLLRNDRLVAVIAAPGPTRHANMTVRNVGGCVIDLTAAAAPDDQLGAYYPGDGSVAYAFAFAGTDASGPATLAAEPGADGTPMLAVRGEAVFFRVAAAAAPGTPRVEVTYRLADGDDFLTVTSTFTNPHDEPITVECLDRVRADRTFTSAVDPATKLVWWDDEWFGQAYGIVPVGATVAQGGPAARPSRDPVRYVPAGGDEPRATIPPGGTVELVRRLFPAPHLLGLRALAAGLSDRPATAVSIRVRDPAGPVAGALVTVVDGDSVHGAGRTGPDGRLETALPRAAGTWRVRARTVGRASADMPIDPLGPGPLEVAIDLPPPGVVVGRVTSASGGPIPCKVQFRARAGATGAAPADPDLGPDSGHTAVKNLVYSHDGGFRQEVPPGDYDVIVSLGPEFDAVFTGLTVVAGREVPLEAVLRRSVDTAGWVSSDFHSHATESGDNTTSQFGRVQNLLCEHIEFAPCTEHNRISSYAPHLERLDATHLMATCSGMELTGSLLPVNHQNAFPLLERRHTQDGGGPTVRDDDPVAQIERLALWDGGSDKVVQMNHPHLVQVLGDRDTDGSPDGGFAGMLGFVDVIEVHPPHEIFLAPAPGAEPPAGLRDDPRKKTSTIFVWLQMLNLGYRVPGVVNTDAHYAFHGSGWLRNWIASPTDDPARVAVADVVNASESGRIVMSNGPFLEARLTAVARGTAVTGGPGDEVADDDGAVALAVRVQCPNWLDVDRVQVFVNGRADPALGVTRRAQPERFSRDTVRFDHTFAIRLEHDAHLIVAAIGEESALGPVMGPEHAGTRPVAVANPVFVDVGGDGFTPNGDLLGLPIPHPSAPTHRRHVHDHAHPHRHRHPHD
jgi:hypothetical protein